MPGHDLAAHLIPCNDGFNSGVHLLDHSTFAISDLAPMPSILLETLSSCGNLCLGCVFLVSLFSVFHT